MLYMFVFMFSLVWLVGYFVQSVFACAFSFFLLVFLCLIYIGFVLSNYLENALTLFFKTLFYLAKT